jgi:oxygen-dependent protoporphyrinogen oxidase
MSSAPDTLVVGAGISGLAYAHALGPDARVLVLEASQRAGGLVRTERFGRDGRLRCEAGPEALRSEQSGELAQLFEELGLRADEPRSGAKQRFLVHRGRLHAAPLGPRILTTPLLSLAGKLRIASEPFRDPRRGNDGSIADFVRHRIGQEALDALLDPLVGGIHAGDPEQLSMRACFPRLVELVETHGGLFRALLATRGEPAPGVVKPRGGCQVLTDALAASLGTKLVLSTPVESLSFDGTTWRARCERESFAAARLVLAVPCATAARLLNTVAPDLARAIGSIRCESLVSVTHAWPRERVRHALDGFGYLAASRERLRHLGTLFSSSIAPDAAPESHVVLRTLLGGARRPATVDASDAELRDVLTREVAPLLGLSGEPEELVVHRWRSTLPRFDLDHPRRVRAIRAALPPGLELLGNWLDGIGVNHLVRSARQLAR